MQGLSLAHDGTQLIVSGGVGKFWFFADTPDNPIAWNQDRTYPWRNLTELPIRAWVEDAQGRRAYVDVPVELDPGNPQFPVITALDGPDLYRLDYSASDPDTWAEVQVSVTNLGERPVTVHSPQVADTVIAGGVTANVPVRLSLTLAHGTDTYSLSRTLTWEDNNPVSPASGSWNCTADGLAVPYIEFVRGGPQTRPSGARNLIDANGGQHFTNGAAGTGITITGVPGGLTWVNGTTEDGDHIIPMGNKLWFGRYWKVASGSNIQGLGESLGSDDNPLVNYRGWRPANIASLPTRLRNKFDVRTWWQFKGPEVLGKYLASTTYYGVNTLHDPLVPGRMMAFSFEYLGSPSTMTVVETLDGGTTWTKRTVTLPAYYVMSDDSLDQGIIRGNLWLIGSYYSNKLLRSTDGGYTFTVITPTFDIAGYRMGDYGTNVGGGCQVRRIPIFDPVSNRIGWILESSASGVVMPGQTVDVPSPAIGWTTDGQNWAVELLPKVYNTAATFTNGSGFPVGAPAGDWLTAPWWLPDGSKVYLVWKGASPSQDWSVVRNGTILRQYPSAQVYDLYASKRGSILVQLAASCDRWTNGTWTSLTNVSFGYQYAFKNLRGTW